jgi:hypothetical protein
MVEGFVAEAEELRDLAEGCELLGPVEESSGRVACSPARGAGRQGGAAQSSCLQTFGCPARRKLKFVASREAQGEWVEVVWDGAEGLAGEYGVVGPRVA